MSIWQKILNFFNVGLSKKYIRSLNQVVDEIAEGEAIYDYIFKGTFSGTAKNWRNYLPKREHQYWLPFCTAYSRLNVAETLANSQGIKINFSDRALAVESGTTKQGNKLQIVAETARLTGLVIEMHCPMEAKMISDGWSEWDNIFSLPDLSAKRRYLGGNHSWVLSKAAMIDALNYGPLQVSYGVGDNYESENIVQNPSVILGYHATTLYYIDEAGQYHIQDSAGKEFKILESNYKLTGVKSFRDLPQHWKGQNFMDEGFTLSHDGKTFIFFKKVRSPEEYKALGSLFKIKVPLNSDGSVNFEEAKKTLADIDIL